MTPDTPDSTISKTAAVAIYIIAFPIASLLYQGLIIPTIAIGILLGFWIGARQGGIGCLVPVVMFVLVGMAMYGAGVIFLAVLFATWLASMAARAFGWSTRIRRADALTLGCYSVVAVMSFVALSVMSNSRAAVALGAEENYLHDIGVALNVYAGDNDGNYPPQKTWGTSTARYLNAHGYPTDLPKRPEDFTGYTTPDELIYTYLPPKFNAHPDEPVITVKAWEREYGVRLYLYASGRVAGQRVWPTWKYIWDGKLSFLEQCR